MTEPTTTPFAAAPTEAPCLAVTVVRFELMSATDSTWCVGFNLKCLANQRTSYVDTTVTRYPVTLSDDALVQAAWAAVKESAEEWHDSVVDQSAVIGYTFDA